MFLISLLPFFVVISKYSGQGFISILKYGKSKLTCYGGFSVLIHLADFRLESFQD